MKACLGMLKLSGSKHVVDLDEDTYNHSCGGRKFLVIFQKLRLGCVYRHQYIHHPKCCHRLSSQFLFEQFLWCLWCFYCLSIRDISVCNAVVCVCVCQVPIFVTAGPLPTPNKNELWTYLYTWHTSLYADTSRTGGLQAHTCTYTKQSLG